jgi:protein arginine kinase activator
MKLKCDHCDKPATIHLTEIANGQKIEKHLCENCATGEGITVKANVPISQLLESFILQTTDSDGEAPQAGKCEICGMTFSEFRNTGLLGCPNDYDAFEESLQPLLERAHEGMAQHIGKVPHQADGDQKRQNAILRLRAELKTVIAAEDYERAAALRDQIKEMERS